jgi:hypothetical protein
MQIYEVFKEIQKYLYYMNLDVDFLINFFDKYSGKTLKRDVGEQEESPSAGSAPTGGGGSTPKWADSYSIKRGKANMLGKAGEKWETGLTRGAANKIW